MCWGSCEKSLRSANLRPHRGILSLTGERQCQPRAPAMGMAWTGTEGWGQEGQSCPAEPEPPHSLSASERDIPWDHGWCGAASGMLHHSSSSSSRLPGLSQERGWAGFPLPRLPTPARVIYDPQVFKLNIN